MLAGQTVWPEIDRSIGQIFPSADSSDTSVCGARTRRSTRSEAVAEAAGLTRTWSSAEHIVKIVVVGTSGRPAITTDGLVCIK
jgi:hypothetical protein